MPLPLLQYYSVFGKMTGCSIARTLIFLGMAFAVALVLNVRAEAAKPDTQRVKAVVLLDELGVPVIGEAMCRKDQRCEVISDAKSGVRLTFQWDRRGQSMIIECPGACSFQTGRSRATVQAERTFDLFKGEDRHMEIPLVLKPRPKIGRVLLVMD